MRHLRLILLLAATVFIAVSLDAGENREWKGAV